MQLLQRKILMVPAILITALLFITDAGLAFRAKKDIKKTFRLEFDGDLRIENVNGRINIVGWDQEQAELVARITVKHHSRRTAEEYLEEVKLQIDHQNDFLDIEVDYPKSRTGGFFSWLFGGSRPSVSVEMFLKVPVQCNVEVATVNGAVNIEHLSGSIQARTTNGNVRLHEVAGDISCRTVNGSISTTIPELSEFEEMRFRTVNGGIRISVPSSLAADLEASTVNGSIESDLPLEVSGKIRRGSIRGKLNGGGGYLLLKTVNGSIRIRKVE